MKHHEMSFHARTRPHLRSCSFLLLSLLPSPSLATIFFSAAPFCDRPFSPPLSLATFLLTPARFHSPSLLLPFLYSRSFLPLHITEITFPLSPACANPVIAIPPAHIVTDYGGNKRNQGIVALKQKRTTRTRLCSIEARTR